jgi:endonuclease YncB( thermonuclease family)
MRNSFQILVVVVAIFGLGLGAAFGAGAFYARRTAPEPPAATPAPAAGAGVTGGAFAGGGAAGATGGASAPTTGVVEEISGDTVTVRTQNGGTVSVKLQGDTQVRQLAPATPSDIRPGLSVIVTGQPDVDGKLAARSVQITGAAPPAGQGGGQGGRPAGSATPAAATPTPSR